MDKMKSLDCQILNCDPKDGRFEKVTSLGSQFIHWYIKAFIFFYS